MGDWAERMIINELQEEIRIKQEKVTLQNGVVREKKQKGNALISRLFPKMHIDNEWLWKFVAYTYFICRTLGLLILLSLLIFGRLNTILIAFIFLCCCYFNLKLYKFHLGKKGQE